MGCQNIFAPRECSTVLGIRKEEPIKPALQISNEMFKNKNLSLMQKGF